MEKRGAEKGAWLLYKFAATVKDLVDDVLEECGEEFEPEPGLTEEQEARQVESILEACGAKDAAEVCSLIALSARG
jgi:hypothetical protein